MSLQFSTITGSYCTSGVGNPITFFYPRALCCWVKRNTSAGYGELMVSGVNGTTNNRNASIVVSSNRPGVLSSDSEGGQSAPLAGTVLTDVDWYCIVSRFDVATLRTISVNGVQEATNAANRRTDPPNVFNIGARPDGGGNFNGLITHASVWSYSDNSDWNNLLSQLMTTRPESITAGTLLHYWPDCQTDLVGSLNLTPVNDPIASEDEPALFLSSAVDGLNCSLTPPVSDSPCSNVSKGCSR